MNNDPHKMIRQQKQLTQIGLNNVLWRLIAANGGRIIIPCKDLLATPPNAAIVAEYRSGTDDFALSITTQKTKSEIIVVPSIN